MSGRPKAEVISVRAIVALYREFENVARRADLSLAQYRMLLYLGRGPQRAGVIAAASALKKPTVSIMLNALRARGWIEQLPDSSDGRAMSIRLTESGRTRIAEFEGELALSMAKYARKGTLARLKSALADFYDDLKTADEPRLAEIEARLLS